jgi:hypothetical protein
MTDPLEGMTSAKWASLSPFQRDAIRDLSGLSPQLTGLEGWRVQVIDAPGECAGKPRRFVVGRTGGWRPCHLEILRSSAYGGFPACKKYQSVRQLEKVR